MGFVSDNYLWNIQEMNSATISIEDILPENASYDEILVNINLQSLLKLEKDFPFLKMKQMKIRAKRTDTVIDFLNSFADRIGLERDMVKSLQVFQEYTRKKESDAKDDDQLLKLFPYEDCSVNIERIGEIKAQLNPDEESSYIKKKCFKMMDRDLKEVKMEIKDRGITIEKLPIKNINKGKKVVIGRDILHKVVHREYSLKIKHKLLLKHKFPNTKFFLLHEFLIQNNRSSHNILNTNVIVEELLVTDNESENDERKERKLEADKESLEIKNKRRKI